MQPLFVRAYIFNHSSCLLARRCNTGFADGLYSMIGGKAEIDETALQAVQRKVALEIGITIVQSSFSFLHILHLQSINEGPRILICFGANISGLAFYNNHPARCDDLRFFVIDQLPVNIIPAHKQIIQCIQNGITYSEYGWE